MDHVWKKRTRGRVLLIYGIAFFISLILFDAIPSRIGLKKEKKEKQNVLQPKRKKRSNCLGVTKADFKTIKNGLTYKEVVEILGKEGEEMSRIGDGEFETGIYMWKTGFIGTNMNITFQNGRVME